MMKSDVESDKELVSALVDGQLRGEAFSRAVAQVVEEQEARLNWHAYHLVGDVLRSGEAIVGAHELAFSKRLMSRLQQEVPGLVVADLGVTQTAVNRGFAGQAAVPAANDASFRWKILAGVACTVAVGLIVWQAALDQRSAIQLVQTLPPGGMGGVAAQSTQLVETNRSQVMIRDPHLDALLAAHQQSGSGSALSMSAGFLRNAAFEGAAQ
jgi:sigma-E factor negative regulatory protein RseA